MSRVPYVHVHVPAIFNACMYMCVCCMRPYAAWYSRFALDGGTWSGRVSQRPPASSSHVRWVEGHVGLGSSDSFGQLAAAGSAVAGLGSVLECHMAEGVQECHMAESEA